MEKVLKLIYLSMIFTVFNGKAAHFMGRNYTAAAKSDYIFKTNSASVTGIPYKISGKWQVGRVSRKQYEIINMLYRKTKTFIETERMSPTADSSKFTEYRKQFYKNSERVTFVPVNTIQKSLQIVHPGSNNRPLTPSYIEFYYLDESDERIRDKDLKLKSSRSDIQNDEYKFALLRPPFFLFRVNDATCKPTLNFMTSSFLNNNIFSTEKTKTSNPLQTVVSEVTKLKTKFKLKNKYVQDTYATRISVNKTVIQHKKNITENKNLSTLLRDRFTPFVPTVPYDRIKFFEIYDSDTYKPHIIVDKKMNLINDNYIQSEEKIYLDQVDHDTGNHDGRNITRFVKKHVNFNVEKNKSINRPENDENKNKTLTPIKVSRKMFTNFSRPAKWSEFPFIAVYVYEPTQVRCDAASISPHWLVVSAICLYRHHKDFQTEGRSAFVVYCSNNWRLPGRIAYVKRSFIHPRFQLKEISRRYLYNIGVIQVINSMANTCSGWRPVSLMSHQFVADAEGTFATAIGWGLDRYETSYSSSDLPKYPLMLYEALVYSDSCPGNADYSKVKSLNEDSVKNVYCLSLPTYTLEENDTVHGGLLLIGGKLIALYLQEERRIWGDQSAQYTGIWRLIPWLLDVARETENLDTFASEI